MPRFTIFKASNTPVDLSAIAAELTGKEVIPSTRAGKQLGLRQRTRRAQKLFLQIHSILQKNTLLRGFEPALRVDNTIVVRTNQSDQLTFTHTSCDEVTINAFESDGKTPMKIFPVNDWTTHRKSSTALSSHTQTGEVDNESLWRTLGMFNSWTLPRYGMKCG